MINRQLKGYKDITLSRVAELAWALGREPEFSLTKPVAEEGDNHAPVVPGAHRIVTSASLTGQAFYQPPMGGIAKAA